MRTNKMYFTIPHLIFDISSKSEGFETIGFSKVFSESNQLMVLSKALEGLHPNA